MTVKWDDQGNVTVVSLTPGELQYAWFRCNPRAEYQWYSGTDEMFRCLLANSGHRRVYEVVNEYEREQYKNGIYMPAKYIKD